MMRSWFDFRAMALALLLAAAAALPHFITTNPHREFFFFDITLTSTAVGSTQLFWDIGTGFNETDSSRQPLSPRAGSCLAHMGCSQFVCLRVHSWFNCIVPVKC